jgi:phospholipase A1
MQSKYLLIFIILLSIKVNFQILEPILEPKKNFRAADSLLKEPGFSVHRDNYFLTGVPINESVTSDNADVKYQVSFKLRLKSKPLWGGFFPYLMYTQKAFWDIYANSKPFSEINFNPGVAIVRPFYLKGERLTYGTISLEHESNGRDSIYSRTWNMLAFSLKSQISPRWIVGSERMDSARG